MIHRVMLLPFSDVVPRSAVTSAEIDLIHVPRGVSSRQNCRDLSDSPGHVYTLLLLVTACFHGSWPSSYSISLIFVPVMMRNVCGMEWSLRKQNEASPRTSFISSYNQPTGGDMQRRDGDTRGMTGAEEEDDSPHARPTAVLQYTFTTTLISGRK